MKLKHWIGIGFLAVGVFVVWHLVMQHGGVGIGGKLGSVAAGAHLRSA